MKRWRASMPRYRTPIILYRDMDGPSSAIGNQRTGSQVVRVLRANALSHRPDIALPSVAPPTDHLAAPGDFGGWRAWWPPVPDSAPSPYRIPDPPTIERPVWPTNFDPVLWEAYAPLGGAWDARISALWLRCEWMPQTGKEQMAGGYELSVNMATIKVRPKILEQADVDAKSWRVRLSSSDWQIESIKSSFRRNEFAEMVIVRTGLE